MSDIEKYEKGKIKFSAMTGSFRIATKLYLYNYGHLNCRKQIVFQLYEIPIDVLKELIMEIEDIKQCYETFDDYHRIANTTITGQFFLTLISIVLLRMAGLVFITMWMTVCKLYPL